MMGCPNEGASDSRTVRGTTLRHTWSPKCCRTSSTTCSASRVRASYMVRMIVLTSRSLIEVALHQAHIAQQLAQAFQGVVLALDRDDDLARGGQTR